MDPRPVVVVGATGILRPLATALTRADRPVVAVARNAADLAALAEELGRCCRPCAADATSPDLAAHVAQRLGGVRASGAVVYGPATREDALAGLRGLVDGPVVTVLTSATAAPTEGATESWNVGRLPSSTDRRLVLGWRPSGRWHTAEDISAEALVLLDASEGYDVLLGVVRPWQGRPG